METSKTTTSATELHSRRELLRREIDKDTKHLGDLRIALKAFVDNACLLRSHRSRFVDLLTRLRDQLAIHFTLKEAGGYLDEVVREDPRLSEAVQRLQEEHAQIFEMVSELTEEAEDAARATASYGRLAQLLDRLQQFDSVLQKHEDCEKQLVFESVDRDIGGQG